MYRDNLPKEWIIANVDSVCLNPQYGYTTKATNEGNLKLLRTTDITSGEIDWDTVPFCKDNPEDIGKYILCDGDVIISRAGSIGVSYLIVRPPRAVFASYMFYHDGFDVDVAESACPVDNGHCVVSRRTDEGKGIIHLSIKHLFRSSNGPTGRNEMGFGGYTFGIGDADVNSVDIVNGCHTGFVFNNVVEIKQAFLKDLILRVQEAFFSLRVRRRNGPVKSGKANQTGFFILFFH